MYMHFERDSGKQDDFYEQKMVFVDAAANVLQMRIQENRVSSLNLDEEVRLRCTCISREMAASRTTSMNRKWSLLMQMPTCFR